MNFLKNVKMRVLNVKKLKYPRNTDTLYTEKDQCQKIINMSNCTNI